MAQRRRQDLIMELIQQNGFVTTEQLVDQFKVTPQTIRRDLNDLASQKKLRRHHGGAGIDSSTVNTAYQARKIMDLEAKERIAEALVDMIPDNSSMFINIGTTTETIAKALLEKNNLQVVTNNLHVASILSAKEDFHIIIAGGEVRNRDGGIVGEATRDFINQFKMDFSIIGISGIHSDGARRRRRRRRRCTAAVGGRCCEQRWRHAVEHRKSTSTGGAGVTRQERCRGVRAEITAHQCVARS